MSRSSKTPSTPLKQTKSKGTVSDTSSDAKKRKRTLSVTSPKGRQKRRTPNPAVTDKAPEVPPKESDDDDDDDEPDEDDEENVSSSAEEDEYTTPIKLKSAKNKVSPKKTKVNLDLKMP